jgi:hypothetical protein
MLAQNVPGYRRLLDSHSFRYHLHFPNRPSTSLPMAVQRARPLRSVAVVVTLYNLVDSSISTPQHPMRLELS